MNIKDFIKPAHKEYLNTYSYVFSYQKYTKDNIKKETRDYKTDYITLTSESLWTYETVMTFAKNYIRELYSNGTKEKYIEFKAKMSSIALDVVYYKENSVFSDME